MGAGRPPASAAADDVRSRPFRGGGAAGAAGDERPAAAGAPAASCPAAGSRAPAGGATARSRPGAARREYTPVDRFGAERAPPAGLLRRPGRREADRTYA